MTIDEIRRSLGDRNLRKVAEATGLHHNTLVSLRRGKIENPNPGTLALLREYLGPAK